MAQTSFYKAVEAFPRALCLLGSKIEDSSTRLKVIENLWEEHGHGDENVFHVKSYINYLSALGLENVKDIKKENIFVKYWIENLLINNNVSSLYAIELAAIEYIYTRVSKKIIETLNRDDFCLKHQQNHYSIHEVLDVNHANDLIDIALKEASKQQVDINNLINLF